MSTHHIHPAFIEIPVAIFCGSKKSIKGMGIRAQQGTVKFLVRVHHIPNPFIPQIFKVEKPFEHQLCQIYHREFEL
jgi:hypothetical protein